MVVSQSDDFPVRFVERDPRISLSEGPLSASEIALLPSSLPPQGESTDRARQSAIDPPVPNPPRSGTGGS